MGTPQVDQNRLSLTPQEVILAKNLMPPPLEKNILSYNFPLELYVHLFSFLDCKSLLGIVRICQEWKSLEIEVFRIFANQVGLEYPKENIERFYAVLKKYIIFDTTSKKMYINYLSRRLPETNCTYFTTYKTKKTFYEILDQMLTPTLIVSNVRAYVKKSSGEVKVTSSDQEISSLKQDKNYVCFHEIESWENINSRYPKTLIAIKELRKKIAKLKDLKKLNYAVFISFSLFRVMNLEQHLALLLWHCRKTPKEQRAEIFKDISEKEFIQLASYDILIEKVLYQLGNRIAKNKDRMTIRTEKALKRYQAEFSKSPVSKSLTPDETRALSFFDLLFLKIPLKESFYRMLLRASAHVNFRKL